MNKLSFVIPCYRSSQTIESVVNEIIDTVKIRLEYDYEIILINDGSPDDVYKKICMLTKLHSCVKAIDLAKNFGQHSALMSGFHFITGDIIICLDDDGQTPANEMFSLIDKLKQSDIVFASYVQKKHSFFRNFGSKINNIMAKILIEKPENITITSYFACKRFIIDEVIKYKNPYPYVSGLLLRTTKNIQTVPVSHKNREIGTSGYTIKKLLSLWFNGFTAFSVKPLRIASVVGVITALCGFIYGIFTVINKLVNPSAPLGYASLMTALLFIGGIIMIILGLIGEYIGRIYISLNNAPQYVIREKINFDN